MHNNDQIVSEFSLEIEQVKDYEFLVRFDKEHYPELTVDEPPPLGKDVAPNPARLLAAAIGNCLTASFLFCARKARVPVEDLKTHVHAQIARNERGRLRVANVRVSLKPVIPESERERANRCLEIFQDYCTVTESVRHGIGVEVSVDNLAVAPESAKLVPEVSA